MTKVLNHVKEGQEREKEKKLMTGGRTNRKHKIINLSPLITETKNAVITKITIRLDLKNLMVCSLQEPHLKHKDTDTEYKKLEKYIPCNIN